MKKGYIQVYTGNGKGKTTASMGLAIRALGSGMTVFFGQFLKGGKDSAWNILEKLDGIELHLFGGESFVGNNPSLKDQGKAKEGYKIAKEALASGKFDVVILDELNLALLLEMISEDEYHELLEVKPEKTELVITGRYAPKYVIESADLVSQIEEVKHYYNDGVLARKGIEF